MKFRKKPVVIEAIQFKTGIDSDELTKFVTCDCEMSTGDGEEVIDLELTTLEGNLHVSDGDWIIKGIKGEFYPCKPDIFEATYEAVTDGYKSCADEDCKTQISDLPGVPEFCPECEAENQRVEDYPANEGGSGPVC